MTDVEPEPDRRHGLRHALSELAGEHAHRHEDEELADDAKEAGFDLGTDIAHPTVRNTPTDFDLGRDIGIENEPPELRDR